MEISAKLDILNQVYDIYDTFSAGLRVACSQGCAACCTQNVTMTTLEGYRILEYLIASEQPDLILCLRRSAGQERFQPALTTNELAALCIQGEDPPDDSNDLPPAACPFLSNNECLIYPHRPFGCRCFFSTERCSTINSAVVEPLLLTVNTLFLQVLEHVDVGGLGGNMTDVLLFLESKGRRKEYEKNATLRYPGLSTNRSIPALMVPPEDRLKIQPLLQKIRNIRMPRGDTQNEGWV